MFLLNLWKSGTSSSCVNPADTIMFKSREVHTCTIVLKTILMPYLYFWNATINFVYRNSTQHKSRSLLERWNWLNQSNSLMPETSNKNNFRRPTGGYERFKWATLKRILDFQNSLSERRLTKRGLVMWLNEIGSFSSFYFFTSQISI